MSHYPHSKDQMVSRAPHECPDFVLQFKTIYSHGIRRAEWGPSQDPRPGRTLRIHVEEELVSVHTPRNGHSGNQTQCHKHVVRYGGAELHQNVENCNQN